MRVGSNGPNGEIELFPVLKNGVILRQLQDDVVFSRVDVDDVFKYCPDVIKMPGLLLYILQIMPDSCPLQQ